MPSSVQTTSLPLTAPDTCTAVGDPLQTTASAAKMLQGATYRVRVALNQQGYAASYIHIYARTVKTRLRFMYREEMMPVDIMAKVAMPRLDKTILPAFTPEEVRRLIDACDSPRDTAVAYCLLDSGCRAAELCKLTVRDVNLKTGSVMIREVKGRKDRVAFLGAKARKVLMKYMMTRPEATVDESLFPSSKTGRALTPDGLLLLLRQLGKKANVPHCHPHTFRRSFALWSLRAGMSVYALSRSWAIPI